MQIAWMLDVAGSVRYVVDIGCYDASEDLILCYCGDDLQYYLEGMPYISKRSAHVRHTVRQIGAHSYR